jgi:heat shock protein HslJ
MRRLPIALTVAAVLIPLLAACAPTSSAPGPTDTRQPGELVGTWTIGEQFDTPEQPFIAFVQDNTWTASDGCNRVQGTWDLSASGVLTTSAGPQTLMRCNGAQLPLAVVLADGATVDGDTLVISSSQKATTTELVRTTERTVGLQGFPIGYWVESLTPTAPFLSISADRTFTGNDGCNTLTGQWESTGDGAVQFSRVAFTMMACPDTDTWLNRASTAQLRNGTLTVQDPGGAVIGQLTSPPNS